MNITNWDNTSLGNLANNYGNSLQGQYLTSNITIPTPEIYREMEKKQIIDNLVNQNNNTIGNPNTSVVNPNNNSILNGWGSDTTLGDVFKMTNTANDALKALNAGWGLFTSISQYGTQKALNKEALANARMKNEALRFDIDTRKAEVARWNQVRSNVNKQMQSASAIKTSY